MLDLYLMGRDAWGSVGWPDGRAPLDQPIKLTTGFSVIRREISKYEKRA